MTIRTFWYLSFISLLIKPTYQQQTDTDDEEGDDDDCAFISGQHCDQNGICKYCAMCLQSSCILSKTVGSGNNPTNCNATQFGTTNLYNWYDYCLSSDNDNNGSYCATSTECYQYRKSAGPSVTYAWHNLTCNPLTCMLVASNGAPPPVPVPPQNGTIASGSQGTDELGRNWHNQGATEDRYYNENSNGNSHYHRRNPFHSPTAIALIIVCTLVLVVALCWVLRLCRKKAWWPFLAARNKTKSNNNSRQMTSSHDSMSTIPSTAPPSFSSAPPDMAMVRHPQLHFYRQQSMANSARSSTASSHNSNNEMLPSYLSPYLSPPKYEQAIVTQIRGLREEEDGISNSSSRSNESSGADQYHRSHNGAPMPSMWVPVYFTQQHVSRRDPHRMELFGFTPNHPFWIQHQQHQSSVTEANANPFDDDQQINEQRH